MRIYRFKVSCGLMSETDKKTSDASRRTFLKIGAAAVGGLVVGAVAVYAAKPSTTSTITCTTTETSTLPGTTVTSTLPGTTVTSTAPGSTVTSTAPGSTVT